MRSRRACAPKPQARPATGKLLVTLIDETSAVLPGGTVTLVGIDATNKGVTIAPAVTTDKGQATFDNLPLGRYTVKGEFTGFQTRTLPEVRVRAGENKQILMLPIDRVTVGRHGLARPASRGVGSRKRHLRRRADPGTDRSALRRSR